MPELVASWGELLSQEWKLGKEKDRAREPA